MNIKKLVIGSVVGTVALYVLGYIIWDVLFTDFFAANRGSATGVMRDTQVIWALVAGTLSYAVLITLAIQGRTGTATIMDGLKIGAIVGFLLWYTADFNIYGVANTQTHTSASADSLI